LGKILENLGKTSENLGKISENPGKNGAQRYLTSENMAANILRKTHLGPFLGGLTKNRSSCSLWENICGQQAHKSFSGKFEEIRAKILRTPKNLPAPTLMPKHIVLSRRQAHSRRPDMLAYHKPIIPVVFCGRVVVCRARIFGSGRVCQMFRGCIQTFFVTFTAAIFFFREVDFLCSPW